ncbi:DUF1648 domain-containing protein [Chryseobacterium kwangjuense]|uniref:DUF1648 domain-containing protein n=1 Tax=Chryseobacterium kwangjuense TaxID=267125 RepID=A0A135WM53_9FLAO|nr:DUF1648 domain-containing protein [Chryseobacterium kwangjuense]KXH85953.1 hypothetical protein AU378_09545 [Chryseobacterium kwangjuense]
MENVIFTIFDIFNFGLLVFFWWFTVKHYKTLPARIPVHFDFDGKADNFGSKHYSFITPVLGTVLYFFFVYALRHPEAVNFPVEITELNKSAQFLIMETFLRWLFVLVMLIFMNGQDYMFRYSFDDRVKPRVPMSTAIFSVIGSLVIAFILAGVFK